MGRNQTSLIVDAWFFWLNRAGWSMPNYIAPNTSIEYNTLKKVWLGKLGILWVFGCSNLGQRTFFFLTMHLVWKGINYDVKIWKELNFLF